MKRRLFTPLLALAIWCGPVWSADGDVDAILARSEPPPGVVFEIVAWSDDFLERALPRVREDIRRLRARFPDMEFAVVSHGGEQFALLESASRDFAAAHSLTRSLVADKVPVHVCGTHASWRDVAAEDFPDYVDVAASAPAQINDYLKLDYLLVRVD